MADEWKTQSTGIDGPANNAGAVTPDDGADLPYSTRGIMVGGPGDVTVDMVGIGTNVTIPGLLSGQVYPIRANRIYATGTSATGIVALW